MTTITVAAPSGVAASPTCQSVLADPFFQGEGQLVVSTASGGTSCEFQFRGGSAVLPELGLYSKCPPQASIIVQFDLDPQTRRWKYDQRGTAGVDNGDCFR